MKNDLAIVTVVYQNYDVLKDFFKSLANQQDRSFFVYVVDQSKDIQTFEYEGVPYKVIYSENKGYSHGINIGLKEAQKDDFRHFLVLNNDVFFEADFVRKVLQSLERNKNAVIGGKIYYAAGYEYHHDRYKESERGKVLWFAGGYVDWKHALNFHRGVDEVDKGQYDNEKETDFITGTLVAFDRVVLDRVGYWDENFFLYFEDADWMERAKRQGIKLIYDPSIVIRHKVSQSTGGSGSDLHQKYQSRNQVRFALRYAPLRTKLHVLKNYLRKVFSPSQ